MQDAFDIILPSPQLAPYIRYYWMLRCNSDSSVSERIVPVGCINLIFHRGNQMFSSIENNLQPRSFVCGLSTNFTDLSSTGQIDMLVVVFQPFGAKAFFSMPMNLFNNETVSVDDLGNKSLKNLEDQILNQPDDKICIGMIEHYFIKRLHNLNDYNHNRVVTVIKAVNDQHQINVTALSDIACLSYKQFTRIFTEHVGSKPKDFLRVVRFQRALHILQMKPEISLTQLAFESGYYDQPHLIKEFKEFSGYTPSEYIAICSPHSDYFSIQ